MNTQALARHCPQCNAPSGPQARFCTSCGASLQSPACAKCGQALAEGARFCTACGAPASSASGAARETALNSTIAGLELALYRAEPRRVLQASLDALAKSPNAAEGVVASVTAMTAYAQLGDIEQAQSSLLRAWGAYAIHLGLTEDQQARFIREEALINDLREVGNRDLQENPWLYLVIARPNGLYLPDAYVSEGASEAEKRRTALEKWAEFIYDNPERFQGALAFLCLANKQYPEAARHLETVLLIARRYESISPVRIELLWPLVMAGDCYWALKENGRAATCWNRARSIGMCTESSLGLDDWGRFALPWIEKAKSRLLEGGMASPPPEISRKASDYLRSAIQHQLEAEQFETTDGGLDELVDKVRQAGRRYTVPLERANVELENMKYLDPFAWALSPAKDSSYWWRYERAKGLLLLKTAFVNLSNEKLALAIASCKQTMDFWPTLTSGALLGGLQALCGLKADARATYSLCLDRAGELAFDQSSTDREQSLAEIREALSQPSLLMDR